FHEFILIRDVELLFFFFFQAEDGIRDGHVTGVQTCALPILSSSLSSAGGCPSIARNGRLAGRLQSGDTRIANACRQAGATREEHARGCPVVGAATGDNETASPRFRQLPGT